MASAKQKIKQSITMLCTLLKYGGVFVDVSPEDFRKAKHGNHDVCSIFEKLNKSTILFCCCNKGSVDALSLTELLKCLNYPRIRNFNKNSSQEHLVLFGWLLCRLRVLEKIKQTALYDINIPQIISKLHHSPKQFIPEDFKDFKTFSTSEKTNYLSWINSQILLKNQEILSLRQSIRSSQHDIEQLCAEQKCVHFVDVILLRYPSEINAIKKHIEKHILILQALLQWKDCENVFWLWLNSIAESLEATATLDFTQNLPAEIAEFLELVEDKFGKLKLLIEQESNKLKSTTLLSIAPEIKNEINREVSQIHADILSQKSTQRKSISRIGISDKSSYNAQNDIDRYKTVLLQCNDMLKALEQNNLNELMTLAQKNEHILLLPQENTHT